MKNKMKIAMLPAVVISMLMMGNLAMASEFLGTVSTGSAGNTMSGIVIVSPVASPVAGTYGSKQNVSLVARSASNIHYTIDGAVPTCSTGSVYSDAIVVSSSETIKAISCYSGDVSSNVSSSAYTLTLIDGNGSNVSLSSALAGEAGLPAGVTGVALSDSTVLDLSSSKATQESADVTVGGNVVTLTQNVTLQSGVEGSPIILTNSNLSTVSASIPDGTKIQGPAGWDGKITPPVSGTTSGTAPAGFTVGSTVVSIGSPDGTLVFDNAVTILLAGVTGSVGYRPSGSNAWVKITNVCGGSYVAPTAPALLSECAISNGTDTKIVTYHFTTFGGLNAIPAPAPAPVSSGGGGGGVISGPNSVGYNAVIPTVVAPVKGMVLGATAYNFTSSLALGSRGEAVTQLQNYLTSSGFYKGPVTGYFGALTKVAVVAMQKANGLSQVGNVGPMTRALLNKGFNPIVPEVSSTSTATVITSSKSSLTVPQIRSIIGLLQSFGADQTVINNVTKSLGGQ